MVVVERFRGDGRIATRVRWLPADPRFPRATGAIDYSDLVSGLDRGRGFRPTYQLLVTRPLPTVAGRLRATFMRGPAVPAHSLADSPSFTVRS